MSAADIVILALPVISAAYGAVRGLRPALYLLVTFLAALLSTLVLTIPLERLFLAVARIGGEAYADAPAVAVFILEDRTGAAYAAALIPAFITVFAVFALALGAGLTRSFIAEASRGGVSRLAGGLIGLLGGTALSLLFAAQLLRLPSPAAGELFRGSLLTALLESRAPGLLTRLAGGL